MAEPLVTALVITYRAEKYIKETLDSVFGQTYENVEVVITDDNSPDNTFEEIKKYVTSYSGRYKVIINQNNTNLGIAGNVNKGVELSHGDYICIFDGDDIAMPQRIQKSMELINQYHVEGLTFNMEIIDSDSNHKGYFNTCTEDKTDVYTIGDYVSGNIISGGAARIITRKMADTFGPLNPECNTEDSTYMFRTFLMGKAAFAHLPMVKYRIHGDNVSSFHGLMTRFDTQKIYNQYIKDLETALSKNLIDIECYAQLNVYLKNYLRKGITMRRLYSQPNYIVRLLYVTSLIFNPKFSINEIKGYLKQVKSWHLDGTTN